MLTMAVGHSDDVDPDDAIDAVIGQCRTTLDGRSPQAGMLFSGFDSFDISLVARVRGAFPGVRVMGSTSAAEISSVNGYLEDSVTLALFASDSIDITTGFGGAVGQDLVAACASAADEALAGTTRKPRICIVLTEAYEVDPQLTLDALADRLPGVVLLGGTSARSDFATVRPTFQFCDERVATDGVAILLFSGPVSHSIAVGTGWRTLGPTGTVTRADHGIVHEIDERPAIEFLARYLDVTGPSTFGNPLAVFEDGHDEYYLRATPGSDAASGAVLLAGSIPTGARVQLTTADTDAILAGTHDALVRARDGFPADVEPEAALIFSCAVRKFLLGSRTRLEAEDARAVLGPTMPTLGMYCYGEVGPVKGAATSRYLNETFVTLLLGA